MALVGTISFDGTERQPLTVGVRDWVVGHAVMLLAVSPALVLVGVVEGVNNVNTPAYTNDDPATYLARAWAVQTGRGAHRSLAPYTYWYDHVPWGWIQIVPITWLTDAFRPGGIADTTGRQIALGYAVVSTLLIYVVARRLGCSSLWSLVAMGLFGLNPFSLEYLRQMYLDCLGLPWLLAAFVLALSPRRRLWAFAASGACFAGACLTKETFVLWLPALVWLVWVRADPRTRRMCLSAFAAMALVLLLLYPMYAVLKGELMPGKGHVSLIGAIEWQLAQRAGSGSVFTPGTDANQLVMSWFDGSRWLWVGGLAAMPLMLLKRDWMPMTAALGVPVLYMLHPGYLPGMFIIGAIPFAALAIACACQLIWSSRLAAGIVERAAAAIGGTRPPRRVGAHAMVKDRARPRTGQAAWKAGCFAGFVLLGAQFVPGWVKGYQEAMTVNSSANLRASEAWVENHVPRSATLLVDDNVWIDLVDDGYQEHKVVWFWELDSDPDVERRFPGRWRQMDYVVLTDTVRGNVETSAATIPSVWEAIVHSTVVANFGSGPGDVEVRKVRPALPEDLPSWLPRSDRATASTRPEQGETS